LPLSHYRPRRGAAEAATPEEEDVIFAVNQKTDRDWKKTWQLDDGPPHCRDVLNQRAAKLNN
jgi:hypothetical protein